jgi:hypothetical protein
MNKSTFKNSVTAPTFIIVGAARSGTTSLYDWLQQHPQVFMSPIKETNHFSQLEPNLQGPGSEKLNEPLSWKPDGSLCERHAAIVTSWDDYLALFAASRAYAARGEASPSYLYYSSAAGNIRRRIPHCKIIIVLRNPVDRAFSNYKALVRWGRETLDFETALAMEDQRLSDGWEHFWALKGLSLYAEQVRRYLNQFPRTQIGIWLYDDLTRNPGSVFDQVCMFIGVEPFSPCFTPKNVSNPRVGALGRILARHPQARQTMRKLSPTALRSVVRSVDLGISGTQLSLHPETKAQLWDFFHDDVAELDGILPELDVRRWLKEYRD